MDKRKHHKTPTKNLNQAEKKREHGRRHPRGHYMAGQTGAVICYGPVLLTVGTSGRSDHECPDA